MGSLTTFGDMIEEETGIEIRTIEMVSTPIVLEVLRKSLLDYSIDEILESFNDKHRSKGNILEENRTRDIIISACFTGNGASKKIQNILKTKVADKNIDIFTINIIGQDSLENRLIRLKDKHNILAIVSTVPLEVEWAPVFSALEILESSGLDKLNTILEENHMCSKVSESLMEHLTNVNGGEIVKEIRYILYEIENSLGLEVNLDVKMGIVLHICFLIDNLVQGNLPRKFEDLEEYKIDHSQDMEKLKRIFQDLELKYNISIGEDEIAYILKLFLSNKNSV